MSKMYKVTAKDSAGKDVVVYAPEQALHGVRKMMNEEYGTNSEVTVTEADPDEVSGISIADADDDE